MHLRGHAWLGGLLCALALAVVLDGPARAAGPETKPAETTHEASGEHGGGGLISLDKSLIVQAINFIILLVILQRLLYKPLLAKMDERTSAIKKSLDEAQSARAEAARQADENATRLRQAHAEAAAIREQALKEAGEEQRRLVESARAEAHRLVESAKAQMDADIRRAREELRREMADLATAVAEKLVRRSLRDEDHRRIVADAIGRFGN
ncbi:MAG: ATP synthase F0 subunit B [Candidatus Rokuibacteriota bacterium]|nr:MAG: ATP synthase F0 subunit B [Candidatus Rokubacteria bacterium]